MRTFFVGAQDHAGKKGLFNGFFSGSSFPEPGLFQSWLRPGGWHLPVRAGKCLVHNGDHIYYDLLAPSSEGLAMLFTADCGQWYQSAFR